MECLLEFDSPLQHHNDNQFYGQWKQIHDQMTTIIKNNQRSIFQKPNFNTIQNYKGLALRKKSNSEVTKRQNIFFLKKQNRLSTIQQTKIIKIQQTNNSIPIIQRPLQLLNIINDKQNNYQKCQDILLSNQKVIQEENIQLKKPKIIFNIDQQNKKIRIHQRENNFIRPRKVHSFSKHKSSKSTEYQKQNLLKSEKPFLISIEKALKKVQQIRKSQNNMIIKSMMIKKYQLKTNIMLRNSILIVQKDKKLLKLIR